MGSTSITYGNNFKASAKLETEYINGKEGAVIFYDKIPSWLIVPSQIMGYDVIRVKLADVSNIAELTYITLPDTVMVVDTFSGAILLETIKLPKSMVICPLFTGCVMLKSITIPDSITIIQDLAFTLCTSLESVDFGKGVHTIKNGAFTGCTALKTLTIPDNIKSIESSAFEDCSGITSLNIGNGLTYINPSAFEDCSGITSLVIGENMANIGETAFEQSASIRTIMLKAKTPPAVDKSSFKYKEITSSEDSETKDFYYDITLNVPQASLTAYQNHKIWGKFKTITGF